jgi:hypothetical protein
MQPIQTRYKGYHFRSRLEARWAVFFDSLDLKWEYEPEGFVLPSGLYLPDFRVIYPGRNESERHDIWFECKGDLSTVTTEEWQKMLEFHQAYELMVLDGTPDARMYLNPYAICHKHSDWGIDAEDFSALTAPFKAQPHAFKHKRVGHALWCPKGRLWWDDHDDFFAPTSYGGWGDLVLERAVDAARSARFEHGQRGAT